MTTKSAIYWIMAGVLLWGIYHAIGAYWNFIDNSNPWRMVMVLGCVLGFLSFWLVMLRARERRLSRRSPHRRLGPGDAC